MQTIRPPFLTILISIGLFGCASLQLQENTLQVASTLEQIRFSQLLFNISNQIDRPDSDPSILITNTGTAQSSLGGTVTAMFSNIGLPTFSKAVNPSVTGTWQDSWSLNPISDPQDLQNLRALYGLIYRTDDEIAQVIYDESRIYGYQVAPPECGISWNPPTVVDPSAAIVAYFLAINAFPYPSASSSLIHCYSGLPLRAPTVPAAAPAVSGIGTGTAAAPQTTARIVGNGATQVGTAATLNTAFGLSYPSPEQVYSAMHQGISAACKHYQVTQLQLGGPAGKRTFFARWLFWKDVSGNWKPERPPAGVMLESLGTYGDHEFFTSASACVSDFIILAISATANSHSAAQASPKSGTASSQ